MPPNLLFDIVVVIVVVVVAVAVAVAVTVTVIVVVLTVAFAVAVASALSVVYVENNPGYPPDFGPRIGGVTPFLLVLFERLSSWHAQKNARQSANQ